MPNNPTDPKFIKKGFSIRQDRFEDVQKKVKEQYGGVLSRYIQELIDLDLQKTSDHELRKSETPIGDLIREYHPLIEDLYNDAYKSPQHADHDSQGRELHHIYSERRLLQRLLEQSISLIRRHHEDGFAAFTDFELEDLYNYLDNAISELDFAKRCSQVVQRPESVLAKEKEAREAKEKAGIKAVAENQAPFGKPNRDAGKSG